MNYSELKTIAESRKILIKDLAEALGMTSTGFKTSFENGSLAFSKVPELCKFLKISILDFYGTTGDIVNQSISGEVSGTVTGIDRRQYYSDSPDVLKAQVELLEERIKEKDSQIKEKDSQIKEKDSQIKEKDSQIKDLLTILKSGK